MTRSPPSRAATSRCWSALAPEDLEWSAPTCLRPTPASSARRARRSGPRQLRTSASSWWENPANTNALLAADSAPDVPADRFTALTRLDHNRAVGQLTDALDAAPDDIDRLAIWGNHSATQFPDVSHAVVRGEPVIEALSARLGGLAAAEAWLDESFIPRVAKRGAEIIEVRGSSSVASAANAAIEHVRDEQAGTAWTSAAVVSTGEYGVPEGLVCSFPVRSEGSGYRVIEGLAISERSRARMDSSVAELVAERDAVRALGLG